MEIQEYSHIYDRRVEFERLINFKGSNILAVQAVNETNEKYVIIPGYVIGTKTKKLSSKNIRKSKIRPVNDSEERKDLKRILTNSGFEGPINFWN